MDNYDSGSWIWDDLYANTTDINTTYINTTDINYNTECDNITNHWMFLIFSGYILPFISPKVRSYCKEVLNSLRNNEITGKIVTLSEFGFTKIQTIENNNEMKIFIKRICDKKQIKYNKDTVEKIAWLFSGDSNDTHASIHQTWTKLNKIISQFTKENPARN